MEYTTQINEPRKFLFIRISGILDIEALSAMGIAMRLKAKELNYKLLFDFRKIRPIVSVINKYNWIEDNYDHVDPLLKYIPTAHLAKEEDMKSFRMLETFWMNKGAEVKLFSEEDDAIKWLDSFE
jgi:hypothetical protein